MAETSQIQMQRERLLADFKKEGDEMRSYVNVQGITVYGIFLGKFTPKYTDESGEQKAFECEKVNIMPCSFHRASLPEDQQNDEKTTLVVFPPSHRRSEPIPDRPADAEWPATHDLHLKHPCWFISDDKQRSELSTLRPGDPVKVAGVYARGRKHSDKEKKRAAADGREPRPTAAQLKFGVMHKVRDVSAKDLYAALREDGGVRTSRFEPPGSSNKEGTISDEDPAKILIVNWGDEPPRPGEPLLVPQQPKLDAKNWKYELGKKPTAQASPEKEKAIASLSFVATQEIGEPLTSQNFFVDLTVWNDALSVFGISDVQKWAALAARVFEDLPYILFGGVNGQRTRNMKINSMGDGGGKQTFAFGVCLTARCILTDVAGHYANQVGVPVSKVYVQRRFKVGPAEPHETTFPPPDFACLDCCEDKEELVHHPSVRFFALAASYYQGVSKLSEGEGDALMRVLDTGRSNELPKEHPMFSVVTGTRSVDGAVTSVVFAIRDDRKTTEAEKKRRADAVRLFFTGEPASISDSAPALDPVDDDDDDGLDEISEHEHEHENKSEMEREREKHPEQKQKQKRVRKELEFQDDPMERERKKHSEPEPEQKRARKELEFQDDPMERDSKPEEPRDQHRKRLHREGRREMGQPKKRKH